MGNALAGQLAKNTVRRGKLQKQMREAQAKYMQQFDKNLSGTLSREEVRRAVAETVYDGKLAEVSEDDVDLVMRLGGETCQPEIKAEELPVALAIMHCMRGYSSQLDELFEKFDVDKSKTLDLNQLTALLSVVNDGVMPSKADVEYILRQCEPRGQTDPIRRDQLKPAVACWYCLKTPTSDKIKEMFKQWDTAGNGVISKAEMSAVMKMLHPDIKDEELDIVFKSTDKNGNGVLEYSEFVDWIMSGSDPALKHQANSLEFS